MLSVPDCVRRGLHCWKVWGNNYVHQREVPKIQQMQLSNAQFSNTKGHHRFAALSFPSDLYIKSPSEWEIPGPQHLTYETQF